MPEINTNMILDGITLALRTAYPNTQIESNAVEQRLRAPAFLVLLVSAEQVSMTGSRWKRLPRFDVLYFPRKKREECYAVADDLCSALELITLPSGDKLRGTDMSFEVESGVLHFLVSYNHFVFKKPEETMMGSLKIEQGGN